MNSNETPQKVPQKTLIEVLDDVLMTLTYREREILKLRYGLGDGYIYTRIEAGRIFKVIAKRIHQIENKAIRKLQYHVRSRHLEPFCSSFQVEGATLPEHFLLQKIFGASEEKPNLFQFASKERWQDAFIAWLIAWARDCHNDHDEPLHKTGVFFLNRLLGLHQIPPCEHFHQLKIRKYKGIDILVTVNREYLLLIEDKVNHIEKNGQLERYLEVARNDFPKRISVPVYFKTGQQICYQAVENAGWRCFLRKDMLEVLDYGKQLGVKNDTFSDFHSRLKRKDTLHKRRHLPQPTPTDTTDLSTLFE